MLRATLSNNEFGTYEYGEPITVRIYDEDEEPFDATGYTATVIIEKDGVQRLEDIELTWITQNQGVGTFALTSTNMFASQGIYELFVALTKSGIERHTKKVQLIVWRQSQK